MGAHQREDRGDDVTRFEVTMLLLSLLGFSAALMGVGLSQRVEALEARVEHCTP